MLRQKIFLQNKWLFYEKTQYNGFDRCYGGDRRRYFYQFVPVIF